MGCRPESHGVVGAERAPGALQGVLSELVGLIRLTERRVGERQVRGRDQRDRVVAAEPRYRSDTIFGLPSTRAISRR